MIKYSDKSNLTEKHSVSQLQGDRAHHSRQYTASKRQRHSGRSRGWKINKISVLEVGCKQDVRSSYQTSSSPVTYNLLIIAIISETNVHIQEHLGDVSHWNHYVGVKGGKQWDLILDYLLPFCQNRKPDNSDTCQHLSKHTHEHIHTWTYVHTFNHTLTKHTHTHMHMYAYTYAQINTNMHINTQSQ